MATFDLAFTILLVLILSALGVSNFVESTQSRQKPYQQFFGLLYLIAAIGLVLYKIANP